MTTHTFKLRVRRRFRQSKRRVETLSAQTSERIDRNFIRRLGRLLNIERFLVSWVLLLLLLIGGLTAQITALGSHYQHLTPVPGGIYTEGILGDFTNANPLYATGTVDSAVSHLVFSGLFKYDANNHLVGDLASDWSPNARDTIFTVHLKPQLYWQDQRPLTVADVAFTYHVIQDPDASSPLLSSWQGVTIATPNESTIVFTLPSPLASFPYSLTNGIIPEHLLSSVPMPEMRSSLFNTVNPIGSGPFAFKNINVHGNTPETREESIELSPFTRYSSGAPKLSVFEVRAFHDQKALVTSFNNHELTAMSGLNSVPTDIVQSSNVSIDNFPLTAAVMVFFKTSGGVLADVNVRQALVKDIDLLRIMDRLGYPTIAVKEPLLEHQLGYDPAYQQSLYDPSAAARQLTSDGWIMGAEGIRYKGGQSLRFSLSAANTEEYTFVAKALQTQWKTIGVAMSISLQDNTTLQNTVDFHDYDALLNGISIGIDPDVFAYWDSSQADPRSSSRLNFSEYKSSIADDSLEQGRTRSDPLLRAIKYRTFLQAWQSDVPALGLYQPRFLYITSGPVYGLHEHTINSGVDRYANVQNLEIHEARITN